MIFCVENPKELELSSNYSKFAGYKINIQKWVAFLYTRNEQWEFEIRKNTTISISTKNLNT